MAQATRSSLKYTVIAECNKSHARTGVMSLTHHAVETPVFMPVGTQGTLKGILPDQLEELGYQIILGNTYHLGIRPGPELLKKVGGLHKFMGWNRALLTDSGGFQMVSLLKLAEITEDGVKFKSPYGVSAYSKSNISSISNSENELHETIISPDNVTMKRAAVRRVYHQLPKMLEKLTTRKRYKTMCVNQFIVVKLIMPTT